MSSQRFFFLHIMKTGGGTLRRQILANFARKQVYPCEGLDSDMLKANTSLEYLVGLPPSRRSRIRVFTGHFPFMAVEVLGGNLTTITILRDPVERTLSFLRRFKSERETLKSAPLEGIYEHPFVFSLYIKDHQAKLFALTVEDRPKSYLHGLDVDASRLQAAKQNLERVDVIGTHDRYDEFLSKLEQRFGWTFRGICNRNVTTRSEKVPASFRRRIAEENPADMEFFEHALQICEQRRRVQSSS
jgi:hypothetical protein